MLKDYVGPLLLGIVSYLASMLINSIQSSIEQSTILQAMNRKMINNLNNHTVTDGFIEDENILKKLQDPALWNSCNKADAMWWDGKSKPANVWEELAKKIWEERYEFQIAAGFEYWCNIIKHDRDLPWHIDKDEDELKLNRNLITPLMGSVYYGFDHHFDKCTGHLLLVDADVIDNPLDFDYKRRNEVVEVEPKFNRMVMFNASKWHRVTGVKNGLTPRYTFAVNANSHKPDALKKDAIINEDKVES